MINKDNLIIKIAEVLLKQEVPNWTWALANSALKGKYLKQAEELYEIFIIEKIIQ